MKTLLRKGLRLYFIMLLLVLTYSVRGQSERWIAPEESKNLVSPLSADSKTLAKGKKIYYQICATCHGRNGVGDGPGGKELEPQPADHTSDLVQDQSNGELYWKISNGRDPMPTYSQLLSKTQRWQVIEYIRTLKKN